MTWSKSRRELETEIESLKAQLAESMETLRAIREGEVDAIVVSGARGEMLYSLVGAESVYRLIVETMKEAALAVTPDGRILFCNSQFGQMVNSPLDGIVGRTLQEFVAAESRVAAAELLTVSEDEHPKHRLVFQSAGGDTVPAYISTSILRQMDEPSICIVATDLTELENSTATIGQLQVQGEALRQANAQLQAQSEKLQALNLALDRQQEALAAANEALHAQQEELRAANEELLTANQELQASRESERARAEELATVLDAVPAAVFITHDTEAREMIGSLATRTLLRQETGANLSKSASSADAPINFRAMKDGVEISAEQLPVQLAAREGREVRDCEFDIVLEDGTVAHLLGNAVPLHDGSGNRCGAVGAFVDITARRRTEKVLRETEERFRTIIENSRDGINLLDLQTGRYVYLSPAQLELSGFTEEEMKNISFQDAYARVHPDDRDIAAAQHRRVAAGLDPGEPVEYRWKVKSGEYRWFSDSRKVIRDDRGRPVAMVGVSRDITERKHAESLQRQLLEERERLLESERSARGEADRANRLKDEFLANLSHELRTPLNSILGWTQILRKRHGDPESVAKGLEVIERSARNQTRLISDLLDLSRIISGKMRLQVVNCDPVESLEAAIDSLRPAAEGKGIAVEREFGRHAEPVLADPDRLQQAFWNLLSNAIKFTPPGGRVQIGVRRLDSRVEITFRDTGKGINRDFLPHMFQRFRQANSSASKEHAGLGLGLAIVKHLVELHGGTVSAESAGEGQGATFIVTLPVSATKREQNLLSRSKGVEELGVDPSALAGMKVLFVDDEPDTREMVKRLLGSYDIPVIAVGSASEAVAAIQELRPDVLIGDIGMPGEDGYQMIRRIRELPADAGGQTPAVALTAYSRMEDRTRAMVAGYQYHLAKPVDAAELITTLGMVTQRLPRSFRKGQPPT